MGVNVKKMKQKAKRKDIDVRCEYDGDQTVYVNFDRIKHATSKAALFIIEGEEHWIPFSHLADVDTEDQVMVCSEWIAEQEGLEGDW